jgi:succinyl-diaminopimelate desuccinylase
MMPDLSKFVQKYQLACEAEQKSRPEGGMHGLEIEWNLLDSKFRPLLKVGSGAEGQSFVDYLRSECLSPRLKEYSQLEVFHWMIEWATRPHFRARAAVAESRLMEGALVNALDKAGRKFDERLYVWYGNLPISTPVSVNSIPESWHLAKRRYLEKCVLTYGDALATTGTHSNLSLPDALLEWDYLQLPAAERAGGMSAPLHFEEYKSQCYITASRVLRAFAPLFIATSASTPLRAGSIEDAPAVFLTGFDSVRNLTFPNPAALDLPNLYRSLDDYLRISYDLVRKGLRFGNNNWTPVRARSPAEPVEQLIESTSDQLRELSARGLFILGDDQPFEEIANEIEIQNLLARINLPMSRVEVRTDDGGHPFEIDTANLSLKHLLLLLTYADPDFGRAFRYDREDILLARRNEELAAKNGLRAEIENPFTGKPMQIRTFLRWTLAQIGPLAEALELTEDLQPLTGMASGGPNTAENMRARICGELGTEATDLEVGIVVPIDLLRELAEVREIQVMRDVERVAETYPAFLEDSHKISEFLQYAREGVHLEPGAPVRFRPRPEGLLEIGYPDKPSEIVYLASKLVEIPSVTACPEERLDEVRRASTFIYDYLLDRGLEVQYFDQSKYPALLVGFPGQKPAPVLFSGHFDVVQPDPDDDQFFPFIEGDYLWGRGAADMKTVVATYMVWMKDQVKNGGGTPPVGLLLVGNEENGEGEAMGTPHVVKDLQATGHVPQILIAGERTGEKGDEMWGQICTENRGIMRFEVTARGERGHSGAGSKSGSLIKDLLAARSAIDDILSSSLTLSTPDGWQSQVNYSYLQAGTPGVFNITPDRACLGIEVRSIPQDDLNVLVSKLRVFCDARALQLDIHVCEGGVVCDPQNPYLAALIQAVFLASGSEPSLGRKLPGTSARFAPQGQGVVWGQSGLGPHARDEPSIL